MGPTSASPEETKPKKEKTLPSFLLFSLPSQLTQDVMGHFGVDKPAGERKERPQDSCADKRKEGGSCGSRLSAYMGICVSLRVCACACKHVCGPHHRLPGARGDFSSGAGG